MRTEFGIHHRLESCMESIWNNLNIFPKAQRTSNKMVLKKGVSGFQQVFWLSFYIHSHSLTSFVASVNFKNHQTEASHWLLKHFKQSQGVSLELTLATKRMKWKWWHMKGHVQLENSFFFCVPFCLRSFGPFERCVNWRLQLPNTIFYY